MDRRKLNNRPRKLALLALPGILALALVVGCGGGSATEVVPTATSNSLADCRTYGHARSDAGGYVFAYCFAGHSCCQGVGYGGDAGGGVEPEGERDE